MLTDDELLHIVTDCPVGSPRQLLVQVARAIEAKVQEKQRAEIDAVLDDADDWARYVVEDFAPIRLRAYLQKAMAQRAAAHGANRS